MIGAEDILKRELPLHGLMAQKTIGLKSLRLSPKIRNAFIAR
jgi:hypothetical protein